jgi:pimeloyl-ACP methyl ester carboxylesterase
MDEATVDGRGDEQTAATGQPMAWSMSDSQGSTEPGSLGRGQAAPRFGARTETRGGRRSHPWRVAPRSRASAGIVGVCVLALVASACGSSASHSDVSSTTAAPATTLAHKDFAGLVDIGGGRQIWATCRGQGSPTVVLMSGHGNGAEDWSLILDPDDPAHQAPGDDVSAGLGKLEATDNAVFPSVARFTRVCAYDRPDIRFTGDVSTPRPQPHPVDLDVSDLHSLLAAIGEPGPFVFVSHSYSGLISTLYARTYPGSIAGLVMVDTVSEVMQDIVTPGALAWWDKVNAATNDVVREGVMIKDAFAQINAAGPMPKVPAIILVADKPFREVMPTDQLQGEHTTFADWVAMVIKLGANLGAETITKTDSGHNIYLYNPTLVTDSIHEIVDDVHTRTTPTTS